jgi:hypothetical protein
MLPNLIVIGAAKCGTTSLHEYLDVHPDVSMSREKELNFFVEEQNWRRGIDWYRAQFDAHAAVRGESSPAYSAFPVYRDVAARIAQTIPDARLVYLVRDPIDRIVSHHRYRSLNWPAIGTLEDALRSDLRERLVAPSRYWTQLEQYLTWFGSNRILVVDSNDLREHRQEALRTVFSFLGLEPDPRPHEHRVLHNVARQTRLTARGRRASTLLDRALGPRFAQSVRVHAPTVLKDRLREPVEESPLPDRLRVELADELRPEAERLRAHTGLAFAGWSV